MSFNRLALLAWCSWILVGCYAPIGTYIAAEEHLEIDFRKAATDSLIDYTPASNPGDRSTIVKNGLRVQQVADLAKPEARPREIGAKMLLSGSGDFTAELDWTVNRIEEPKEGWGQGVLFTIELDDPQITELQMSLIAKPGKGAQIRATKKGRNIDKPKLETFGIEFKTGTFLISREGGEAIFSVRQNGIAKELCRIPCPTSDVRYASVWCTRQASGNTSGDYVFHRLKLSADSFFSFQTSRSAGWSWWLIAVIAQLIVLGCLVGWKLVKNRS